MSFDHHLIDLRLVHQINAMSPHMQYYIESSDEVPIQKEMLVRQLKEAEQDMLRAVEKVLGKYHHVLVIATVSRRCPDTEELLAGAGITTEN